MDEQKLRANLGAMDIALTCYESTDSTNLRAKEWARRGGELPAAFLADAQTAGRGRLGRCFLSPAGGLYMSVALDCGGTHPGGLTTLAAAAVLRAGDKLGLPELQIKWVNDLMQHGMKVGGILAEGLAVSRGAITQAVIGIGINTGGESFPQELSEKAASLDTGGIPLERERLAALIISELFYGLPRVPEHMALYRSRCLSIGRDIRFERQNRTAYGHTLGITDEGALIVQTETGVTLLQAGEVSIRGLDGNYV